MPVTPSQNPVNELLDIYDSHKNSKLRCRGFTKRRQPDRLTRSRQMAANSRLFEKRIHSLRRRVLLFCPFGGNIG